MENASLSETSTRRAFKDTISTQKTAKFMWGGEGVLAVAGGTWLTQIAPLGASAFEIVWRSVIGGLGGLATAILVIFLWNLYKAPYRQRNEARTALISTPGATAESPKQAQAELHFSEVKYHTEPSDKNIVVSFDVLLSATGRMYLETIKLEILGERKPCGNWTPDWIDSGVGFAAGASCAIPRPKSGEYGVRLLIYANRCWWASEWDNLIIP